jgi:hypothetical protein
LWSKSGSWALHGAYSDRDMVICAGTIIALLSIAAPLKSIFKIGLNDAGRLLKGLYKK